MKTSFKLSACCALLLPAAGLTADFDNARLLTAKCETALALSALPARLRADASVYRLTRDGFELHRNGSGPFTCIVERNHRDALIPQCPDAAGADTVIPGIIMKSEWALSGVPGDERRHRFSEAAEKGTLKAPARSGISYMMSRFNYAWNSRSGELMQIPPHVMSYAPNVSNDDIGGSIELGLGSNRGYPFIIEEGIHGYMTTVVEHAADPGEVIEACKGQVAPTLAEAQERIAGQALVRERIPAALLSRHRTERDLGLDSSRKPEAFLDFLSLQDGDVVAAINAGGGYNVRLLAALVGDNGKVYASNAKFVQTLFEGINERLAASTRPFPNVSVSSQPDDSVRFPRKLDVAVLNNIYHDLHWQQVDIDKFNASIFGALKPGGLFIIGDHSAAAGSGTSRVGDIHRIEEATVLTEVQSAGFELLASGNFLANPEDDRILHVIDPAIRGQTDRFLLKFIRP